MNGRALLALSLVSLTLAACGAHSRPATVAAPGRAAAAATDPVGRALDRALAQGRWRDLRIEVECRGDAGLRSATVFASGVAIWDRRRQATLPREGVLALLGAFRRHGFSALEERYGGRGDPAGKSPGEGGAPRPEAGDTGAAAPLSGRVPRAGAAALELLCRVRLALDGVGKQVFQLAGGRQSAELRALAEEVLAAVEEVGRAGEGASGLAEGLAGVAEGRLAPETLMLQVLEEPERPGEGGEGWSLALEAGRATAERRGPGAATSEHRDPGEGRDPGQGSAERYGPGEGSSGPRVLALPAAEVAELARLLAAEGFADLPANLWAPRYLDLAVEVLDHSRSLQARAFAGMTRETHAEAQERFERIAEALSDLAERVLAEGRPSGGVP
jgi:hypothetical protein